MGIEQDASTLARALHLKENFDADIFPRGGSQWSHFKRLARFGMLRFTGKVGRDLDREVDDDVWLFELTPEGRSWIQQHENEAKLRDAVAADKLTARGDTQERATA